MPCSIHRECPKCHGDRTMLETNFGVPGYVDPKTKTENGEDGQLACAIPVRLVLCPRCHLLEMYHDVGLGKLV
jgi:hypothetical protein